MSQLGMMVIAVGLSSYNLALFHLINHAFYKALLFLGAGSVIHAVADNQDLRRYGGLINYLPLTYSVMLIASLSLVAFPFLSGFYSKDFILESAFGKFTYSGIAVYVISTIGAIFTTLYSVKILYLTFLANPSGPRVNYSKAHEGDLFMTLPIAILAVFSIFFGFFTKDLFLGLGSNLLIGDNSIFMHPAHEIVLDTEFGVHTFFKLLPFLCTIIFSALAIIISEFMPESLINFKFSRFGYNIFGLLNQKFLIELFYNRYIVNVILELGGQTTKVLDKGSIELIGPWGLEKALIKLSKNISYFSTSIVTTYALYTLLGFISYIVFYFLNILILYIVIIIIMVLLVIVAIYNRQQSNNQSFSDLSKLNVYVRDCESRITGIHSTKRMFSTTRTLLYADNSSGNPDQSRSSDEGSGPESDASDSGVESEPDAVKNIVAFTQGVRPSDLRWSKTEDNYVLKQRREPGNPPLIVQQILQQQSNSNEELEEGSHQPNLQGDVMKEDTSKRSRESDSETDRPSKISRLSDKTDISDSSKGSEKKPKDGPGGPGSSGGSGPEDGPASPGGDEEPVETPTEFAQELQACEMPSIFESDGGD
jgi:NADH-ubiquinone oxidoreductase chain 5